MNYQSVIVTYNRKDKLVEAINSILNQELEPVRLIIIDNHSTDGTKEQLSNARILDNPKVKYLRMPKNYGGSGGFYNGIKEAMKYSDFDFLSLSDDDAIYKPDFFKLIADYHNEHPGVKAFTGTVEYEDGTIQTDHRRKITNNKWLQQAEIPQNLYDHNFKLDLFSFVGCVISRDVLKKIGLPKKNYFIYYDDTEYSLRVRECSAIVNVSAAIIIHKTPKKDPKKKNLIGWKNYYELRNSILMKEEHSSWKWLKLYFYYFYLRLVLVVLFNKNFKGQRRRALYTYHCGFKDGINHKSGKNSNFLP